MAKSKKQRGRPRKSPAEKRARVASTERSRAKAGWTCFNWKVQRPMLAFLERKAREAGAPTVAEYLRARTGAEILAEARAREAPVPADEVSAPLSELEPPGCAGVGP